VIDGDIEMLEPRGQWCLPVLPEHGAAVGWPSPMVMRQQSFIRS
jgi:hypothetical protein